MTNKNTGGPAFPQAEYGATEGTMGSWDYFLKSFTGGMTLRDWMAGMALQGMLSSETGVTMPSEYAELAYKIADAMLKARGE